MFTVGARVILDASTTTDLHARAAASHFTEEMFGPKQVSRGKREGSSRDIELFSRVVAGPQGSSQRSRSRTRAGGVADAALRVGLRPGVSYEC